MTIKVSKKIKFIHVCTSIYMVTRQEYKIFTQQNYQNVFIFQNHFSCQKHRKSE